MKKTSIAGLILGCILVGGISGGAVSYYMQKSMTPSVAAVNVPAIVVSSAQVQQLQQEQRAKIQQLAEFVKKAQEEIKNESDATKKAALEQKYTDELNAQKKAYEEAYITQLNAISQDMTKTIEAEAKKKGYTVILSKEAAVGGVQDITQDMIGKIQ